LCPSCLCYLAETAVRAVNTDKSILLLYRLRPSVWVLKMGGIRRSAGSRPGRGADGLGSPLAAATVRGDASRLTERPVRIRRGSRYDPPDREVVFCSFFGASFRKGPEYPCRQPTQIASAGPARHRCRRLEHKRTPSCGRLRGGSVLNRRESASRHTTAWGASGRHGLIQDKRIANLPGRSAVPSTPLRG
jgi:hypothetical protein